MSVDEAINQVMRPIADLISQFVFYAVPVGGAELPLIVAWLIAGGLFFTIYLGFINMRGFKHALDLCADESARARDGLSDLIGKYEMINIKLDKTGGLTEALALKQAVEEAGLEIMIGCMVATSLAMAPGLLIAQGAKVVDLDGPLLLAEDRAEGLTFEGSLIHPPEPALWG